MLSKWWGKADNSPVLPMQASPVPPQPEGLPVEIVVTNPPLAAPVSVVIELGAAVLHQPPVPIPKLQGRVGEDPVLPIHYTGEIQLPGSFTTGSPAKHRALRSSDAQRASKELSEMECLTTLQKLENDRPSGLRDAEKAFYKILLAKKATNLIEAKSRLLEARELLTSALKLSRENTLCPQQLRDIWSQKIQENQALLIQVAAQLTISLDPEPSPVPSAQAPAKPSLVPEKLSSNLSSTTYMVIGIIALLGAFLFKRGAIYVSRLWRKV